MYIGCYHLFWLVFTKYRSLEFWLSYLNNWFLTCLFALIGSEFIDLEKVSLVWLQIICGLYTNETYRFAYLEDLWKVVERVPVGCSNLFASIDFIDWSNIPFKFFIQVLFFLLLTCGYHIYWICVHWSWNLSSGVIAIFSRPYPKRTYTFASPDGLWDIVVRYLVL